MIGKRIVQRSALLILAAIWATVAYLFPVTVYGAPTSQPITVRTSKDLAKLPNKLRDKTIFVAPGKFDASAKTIDWQRVLFCAADPDNPPTLRLSASQEFRWLFNTTQTTADVTIQNIHADFPGAKSGFLHALGGDQVRLIGCSQNVGNIFWSERKGGRFYIKDHFPGKPADKYQICNFTDPIDELIVDERGVPDVVFFQGLHESDIRDMQSRHSIYLGLHVLGSGYKFAVQDRAGGLHEWIDCTISGGPHHANSCITIGWMAASAKIPSNPLDCSRWVNCTVDGWTQENKTARRIEFINCTVGNRRVSKTF